MTNERRPLVARIDKSELAGLSACGAGREQGRYLWQLLQDKGIDPNRIYRIEYFPHRHCWVLTQEPGPIAKLTGANSPSGTKNDELFFQQTSAEFRRSAQLAFAARSARSTHFASFGCEYQLPPAPEELTPAKLIDLLGSSSAGTEPIHFDTEGGWQPLTRRES